jgi:hypothetical protein
MFLALVLFEWKLVFWNEDVRWWLPQLVEARFAPEAEAVKLLLPCSLFFALLCFVSILFVFDFLIWKAQGETAVRLGKERKPCRFADVEKERWRWRWLETAQSRFPFTALRCL